MKLKAFAKLNLSLRVFEKRPDGFHTIESVMQSVSLCDYLTLTPIDSGIEVICDNPKVPQGRGNIAYKAAEEFLKVVSGKGKVVSGCRIEIEKHIPMAAGLAGGSADAAAVLWGLNQMTNDQCQMSNEGLIILGAQVGSDVPFCLTGGTCLVKGRGEIVEQLEPWPKTYFVLVCPGIEVPTKWAYQAFDEKNFTLPEEIKNDLEPVVVAKHEEIADIKEKLLKLGCGEAQMSGSGSSVFGTIKHKDDAEKILVEMKGQYQQSFLVETKGKGIEVVS